MAKRTLPIYEHWERRGAEPEKRILSYRANIPGNDGKLRRGIQLVSSADGGRVYAPSLRRKGQMRKQAELAYFARVQEAELAAPSGGKGFRGTWRQAAELFIGSGALDRHKSAYKKKSALTHLVSNAPFGEEPMTDTSPVAIRNYLESRYPNHVSRRTYWNALHGMVKWMVATKRHDVVVTEDPICAVGHAPSEQVNNPRGAIPPATMQAILDYARRVSPRQYDYLLFLAYTGWRPSAARDLKKQDVTVMPTHITAKRRVKSSRYGETDEPAISEHLRPLLTRIVSEGGTPWCFPSAAGGQRGENGGASYIIRAACSAAGIADIPRVYDFRHSFIAQLKNNNVPFATAMELSGHRSPDLFLRVYGAISKHVLSTAASNVDYGVASPLDDSPESRGAAGKVVKLHALTRDAARREEIPGPKSASAERPRRNAENAKLWNSEVPSGKPSEFKQKRGKS